MEIDGAPLNEDTSKDRPEVAEVKTWDVKLKSGTKIKMASVNIQGIKRLGKREKIEFWMTKMK